MSLPEPEPTMTGLARRLRQQELIAGFGCLALGGEALQPVLDEACRVIVRGLGVRYAKVLEWQPAAGDFLMRAGVGWHPGVVGHARLGADLASPAGYAFRTGKPVISNHLSDEDRFRTPGVLVDHGVRRALNVLVSEGEARFGVLEADSPDPGDFDRHDVDFLQALANTVAAAVGRQRRGEEQREREALVRSVLAASPDCIKVLDADGTVISVNENGLRVLEIDDIGTVRGRPWSRLWPGAEAGRIADAVAAARDGRTVRFEAFAPTAGGTPRWWDVHVAPLEAAAAAPAGRLVAISRDVTERVAAAAAKDALLREKDLLMQEVHHRVKNSLQLVQSLLQMQARGTADAGAARQLGESAARVRTIGAVHDRLYRSVVTPEQRVEIGPYLAGLIEDLRAAMASTVGDRAITLRADAASWPVSEVPTLGLVLTELVTNALKYGHGTVGVSFRSAPGAAGPVELVVEDEGRTLPAGFDPARSHGFGMRLVTGLLKGSSGGIAVDRGVGHTRFVVLLRPEQERRLPAEEAG